MSRPGLLPRLLSWAERRPEAPALVSDAATFDRRPLLDEGLRRAALLRQAGLSPGEVLAIERPRGLDQVLWTLATALAGGVYLPLDPADPPARREELRRRAGAELRLAPDEPLPRAPRRRGPSSAPLPWPAQPEDPLYILFTSGSTGRPKGVRVPHRAVLRLVDGRFADLGPERTWLHLAPPAFDAATLEIWAPLLGGGRLVLAPEGPLDLAALEERIRRHGVDSAWLTSSLFNLVMDERPGLLRPLRQLLIGGEALSPPHVARALERFPALALINGYGPTENTTFTTTHRIRPEDTTGPIPIGHPIEGTEVRVVDARLRPVPPGREGELLALGEGLALDYVGDPRRTSRAFVATPWGRAYRTGDRVHQDEEGRLHFRGRRDAQIKIHGHRIEPGELEVRLREQAGVRQAAVLVEEGPAGRRLVAHYAGEIEPEALGAALGRVLPAWMRPALLRRHPELPLLPSGKLDRRALERRTSGGEDRSGPDREQGREQDREEAGAAGGRQALARLLRAEGLDPERGFVEQGRDSLDALRLAARARQEGIALVPADLLACQRLAELGLAELGLAELGLAELGLAERGLAERGLAERGLAERGLAAAPTAESPMGAPSTEGSATGAPPNEAPDPRLSLWLDLERTPPGAYVEEFGWRLHGALDPARLEGALRAVQGAHPALRTRLEEREGRLEEAPTGEEIAVEGGPTEAWRARPVDPRAGPLIRAHLAQVGPASYELRLRVHHLAIDDPSLARIFGDLGRAWRGESLRRPPPEPPLCGTAPSREEEARRLRGARLQLARPAGPPPRPGEAAGVVERRLDTARLSALQARARALGATPAALHLALLAQAMEVEDLCLATPISTRRAPDGPVGYHLRLHLLRIRGADLGARLAASARALREALAPALPFSQQLALAADDAEPTAFVYRAPDPPLLLDGLRVEALPPAPAAARHPLLVWVEEGPQGTIWRLHHDGRTVGQQAAHQLAARLEALLEAPPPLEGRPPPPDPGAGPAGGDEARVPPGAATTPLSAAAEALAAALSRLMGDSLQRPPLGPEEDWFAAGGDSLRLLALQERARRELGRELPAALVLRGRSPVGLARLLAQPSDLLPRLRPGPGPRVILLGSPSPYAPLLPHLPAHLDLIALEPPEPGAPESGEIPSLAGGIAAKLRPLRLGPADRLVGYSVHGLLAWELGCRLAEDGPPPGLILLDAWVPGAARPRPLGLRLLGHLRGARGEGRAGPLLLRGLRRRLRWARLALAEARGRPAPAAVDEAERFDDHLRRALHAWQRWRPRPFEGSVLLIRAAQAHPNFQGLAEDGGFGPFARGGLRRREVPGHHLDLFAHVEELAAAIAEGTGSGLVP